MNNRVFIFDTTLRDGEQSPGCSMTVPEKLRMARQLVELGVDILDHTPVLDVKPYVPYADAFPGARAGWLDARVADEPDHYEEPGS